MRPNACNMGYLNANNREEKAAVDEKWISRTDPK
jgi:hypothetical protein